MKIVKYVVVIVFAINATFAMSLSEINKASKDELMKIKGIGEAKAKAIMDARPFKNTTELDDVKGVGPALLENIQKDVLKGSSSTESKKKKINLFEES
ncbi:MAG: helix-hairpin-helix domain-containing protein [Sulfurovaceae bacterium]|nr:helix-hairpin-helix domain-containing protein [Sulfurovaceae bacterium]